jgi:plasmid stabilization system protein ParE
MPETYGVRITPRALKDLEAIFAHIAGDSPQNAPKLIRTLLDAIDGLEIMPGRFNVPRTGYVRGRQIRSMPLRPYLVRYRIDSRRKVVYVLRISHGARRRP